MASTQSIEAGNELVAANTTNVSEPLIVADEYRAGDVVWCKITHFPYWPAQVQDPNHASDYDLRRRRDGCSHFVHLFGEHMNAWCEPSQLVPFVQNFDRLSKAETKALFVKAMEEAAGVLNSSTTTRQRKRSKYLSPPYTDWSAGFKKRARKANSNSEREGNKENPSSEDVHVSGGGGPVVEERDDANALSELNTIKEKLEVTSVILKAYHRKFSDRDKASVAEDLHHLMGEAETMTRKVLHLAEGTSIS